MVITYLFTEDVLSLSKDFSFPDGIREVILPDKPYHVFKMKIHGLLNFLVQSNWYLVYEAEYPYNFVAYWGGSGIKTDIIYMLEHEWKDDSAGNYKSSVYQ